MSNELTTQTGDITNIPTEEKSKKKIPTNVKTLGELLKMEVEEVPMLLSPILKQVGIAALGGSSDVGKSYLCLNLALAVCSDDKQVFGLDIHRKHGKAILICTEDAEEDVSFRLKKMLQEKKVPPDSLRVIFEPENNAATQLEEELKKCPVDLIVIDTLGDLLLGNLNQSIDVRQFFKPYKKIAQKYKCAIIFNHHIGKGKELNGTPHKNDMLGSQGIESACRTVLMLAKKPDGKRVLTVVKGNSIPEAVKNQGIELDFSPATGFTPTGNKISYSEATTANTEYSADEIKLIAKVYAEQGSVLKAAVELEAQGLKIHKNKIKPLLDKHPSISTPTKMDDGQAQKAA